MLSGCIHHCACIAHDMLCLGHADVYSKNYIPLDHLFIWSSMLFTS